MAHAHEASEPLLAVSNDRFTTFPIKCASPQPLCASASAADARRPDPDIWEMYKKAEASFWTGAQGAAAAFKLAAPDS
jgi:hypothetical protein